MLIWLTRFLGSAGTIDLPRFDPVDGLDTGGYRSATLPLSAGGVYDPQRGERLFRGQRTLARSGRLIETSAAALYAAYTSIALASGTDGLLYGQSETGELAVSMPARLLVDPGQRAPRDIYRYQSYWALDVDMTFELQGKAWRGTRHGTALTPLDSLYSLDVGIPLDDVADTTTLDTSPKTIAVANNGNLPTDEVVLSLLAGSADITTFTVQCGKAMWTWTGTLKAGNTLVIDTANALIAHQTVLTAPAAAGATALAVANAAGTGWAAGGRIRIVLDDGTVVERAIVSLGGTTTVNIAPGLPGAAASGREVWAAAYSGFVRNAVLHSIDTWLRLLPGNNSLIATTTGGGVTSTLSLNYFDSWA